jgi:hypothetical protein
MHEPKDRRGMEQRHHERRPDRAGLTQLQTLTTSQWLPGTGYTFMSYRSQVDLNGKRD